MLFFQHYGNATLATFENYCESIETRFDLIPPLMLILINYVSGSDRKTLMCVGT